MKIIKGILKFIINTIMVIAICILILNITGKKVFYDLLYNNLFKPVVIEETKTITKTEASNQDIAKVLENEETEKLINDYIDITMNELSSDGTVTVDIGESFINYIKENKEVLEKELNVQILDEKLDEVKESPEYQQLIQEYKKAVEDSKNKLDSKEKGAIKGYNYAVSNNFRYLLIGIIVLCILLLGLIEKSVYKWMKNTSINTITSGIMVLLTSLLVQVIVDHTLAGKEIVFTTKPMATASIITIVIGIALLIIYIIINKIIIKKEREENV